MYSGSLTFKCKYVHCNMFQPFEYGCSMGYLEREEISAKDNKIERKKGPGPLLRSHWCPL